MSTQAAETTDSIVSIVESINSSGNIKVSQPQIISDKVQRNIAIQQENSDTDDQQTTSATATRTGYRIQVFDDNNPRTARSQAQERKAQLQQKFPQYRTYISFNSPYWRVKLGDFRSRGEADNALEELKVVFPSQAPFFRIVRDKINIYD